jgi:hypothetical protein
VGNDGQSTPERALDLLVYGPLGLALYVRDTVPTFLKVFVARGRSEVERQQRKVTSEMGKQVSTVRSVGETAVNLGVPRVRKRVEEGLREARHLAEQAFSGLVVPPDGTRAEPEAPSRHGPGGTAARTDTAERTAQRSEAASLAIPDYDELSASQVVERLDGLSRDELTAVGAYEQAQRGRRTILFKIEQLTR